MLSIYVSQHERAMPRGPCGALGLMGFVSQQADLTVAMLDCSNKFLLFFLPSVALKAEKRRKLTQGKVLTGRLVYELIFNLFFTNI